jgi:adenine specific DNA methylase Mod
MTAPHKVIPMLKYHPTENTNPKVRFLGWCNNAKGKKEDNNIKKYNMNGKFQTEILSCKERALIVSKACPNLT